MLDEVLVPKIVFLRRRPSLSFVRVVASKLTIPLRQQVFGRRSLLKRRHPPRPKRSNAHSI